MRRTGWQMAADFNKPFYDAAAFLLTVNFYEAPKTRQGQRIVFTTAHYICIYILHIHNPLRHRISHILYYIGPQTVSVHIYLYAYTHRYKTLNSVHCHYYNIHVCVYL